MQVDELAMLKRNLQSDILELINNFTERTNVDVKDITFRINTLGNSERFVVESVQVDLNI